MRWLAKRITLRPKALNRNRLALDPRPWPSDQDIEFMDPVVDSDGNVQPPTIAEGVEITRKELAEPYEACSEHIEGITWGRERADVAAQVDQFVALATCLRDKGYDVDDPTAETLQQWFGDFRVEFDWDDPAAMEAYEECSSSD